MPSGGDTGANGVVLIAKPVAVGVPVPGGLGRGVNRRIGIVYQAVAVVVEAVADLRGVRVDVWVAVVAVFVGIKAVFVRVHDAGGCFARL